MRGRSFSKNLAIACTGVLICLALFGCSDAAVAARTNDECLACHSAENLSKTTPSGPVSLYVDANDLAASVHGARRCTDCHADLQNQAFPHKANLARVQCTRCHRQGNKMGAPTVYHVERFADSVHGSAGRRGVPDAPSCKDCHGTHGIRAARDPKSSVNRLSIPSTCGKCHFEPMFAARHHLAGVRQYKDSVHARMVRRPAAAGGLETAAVCTDCHGVHDIESPDTAGSMTSKPRVPRTCGRCHKQVYAAYSEGIHGRAVAKGIKDAPVCTDCHGEHGIQKPSAASSSVYPTHVSTTCSRCHEDMRIQREYGLPADRLSTYTGSYHGIANKYGDITVANCATCHGAHDIRPSSDPKSAVNKKNLPRTCGKCHPGAGMNFAKGTIHARPSKHNESAVYWTNLAFKLLTVGTMLALIGHIMLDLYAQVRKRRRAGRAAGTTDEEPMQTLGEDQGQGMEAAAPESPKEFLRFSLCIRVQHIAMLTSVIVLIATGLPLKFANSGWATIFFHLVGGVRASGLIHRIAAAILIGVGVFHMGYITLTAEGRREFRELFPKIKDFMDVGRNLLYFFGFSKISARFGRFSYLEKFDYWAVYWGMVVMILSGLILWFHNFVMSLVPKVLLDVAHAAHSDEALLATLAIVIWHFYNVHFHPGRFPMSWTWLNGKISEREMKEDHPLEYEKMMEGTESEGREEQS